MEMTLISPAKILLPEITPKLERYLTFTDRSIDYQLQKLRQNIRWAKADPDSYQSRLEELKVQRKKSILFKNEDGTAWTYSGLAKSLNDQFGWELSGGPMTYTTKEIPWMVDPDEMRYYQKDAVEALLAARHGAIELPTGSGKSLIILNLAKRQSHKCLIVTPSAAITRQLYKLFLTHFGRERVGKYGDGKKEAHKLFTVAVAKSLTNLEHGDKDYDELSKCQTVIWDESHTTPAKTFEKVCLGLLENTPCRFFVSATQIRNDGSQIILEGITGPVVYSKPFSELVAEGYLAQPLFKCFSVPFYGDYRYKDINAEQRAQLFMNPNVNRMAADIAAKAVTYANRQTLIIIEEFEQFMTLRNYLTVPYTFVHGGATKEHQDKLPEQYWECDIDQAVEDFNAGKIKILIGTSAIATGVDTKPVGCLIYLQGGSSETQVRQAIGRGTRVVPGKKDFWVVDFKIAGSKGLERHFYNRKEIYETMGTVEVFAR